MLEGLFMKILIAYASKSGTAKEAAELLAADLQNHTVTVADIEKTDPVPGDFDYTSSLDRTSRIPIMRIRKFYLRNIPVPFIFS